MNQPTQCRDTAYAPQTQSRNRILKRTVNRNLIKKLPVGNYASSEFNNDTAVLEMEHGGGEGVLRTDAHAWLCKFLRPEVVTTGSFVKTSANAALAHCVRLWLFPVCLTYPILHLGNAQLLCHEPG